ncbi:hypothetical protein DE146DRAFT_454727 [Phaeosphaeria sp. MPI-PUGE-AT-0046c]|nr:hypothetical protein DE146DRAFT_454727 [Phaeosphaeria sp. MPI-PUGE-AT-0046c]
MTCPAQDIYATSGIFTFLVTLAAIARVTTAAVERLRISYLRLGGFCSRSLTLTSTTAISGEARLGLVVILGPVFLLRVTDDKYNDWTLRLCKGRTSWSIPQRIGITNLGLATLTTGPWTRGAMPFIGHMCTIIACFDVTAFKLTEIKDDKKQVISRAWPRSLAAQPRSNDSLRISRLLIPQTALKSRHVLAFLRKMRCGLDKDDKRGEWLGWHRGTWEGGKLRYIAPNTRVHVCVRMVVVGACGCWMHATKAYYPSAHAGEAWLSLDLQSGGVMLYTWRWGD